MKYINSAPVRFVFWGGINTILTYGVYLLFLQFLPYNLAYTISYVSGIFISYFLNAVFVFRQALRWQSAIQYPLVYVIQYVLGLVLLTLIVERLGIDAAIASLLNIIILLPITFILTRFILVKKPENTVSSQSA